MAAATVGGVGWGAVGRMAVQVDVQVCRAAPGERGLHVTQSGVQGGAKLYHMDLFPQPQPM